MYDAPTIWAKMWIKMTIIELSVTDTSNMKYLGVKT